MKRSDPSHLQGAPNGPMARVLLTLRDMRGVSAKSVVLALALIASLRLVESRAAPTEPGAPMSLDAIAAQSKALEERTRKEAERVISRLSHAKELLGKHYNASVVQAGEQFPGMEAEVEAWVSRALKGTWKKRAEAVARAIIQESHKHSFDPVFVMAVIENESSFNPEAVGTVGEIGLMQVTPSTGKWIADQYDLPWKGKKSLRDPVSNVRIGTAYLAHLRERFDFHSRLYLAAYNMGAGNVRKALRKEIWPKEYASRVMQRYVRFYTELKDELRKSVIN